MDGLVGKALQKSVFAALGRGGRNGTRGIGEDIFHISDLGSQFLCQVPVSILLHNAQAVDPEVFEAEAPSDNDGVLKCLWEGFK
jgi:hypothetical protein